MTGTAGGAAPVLTRRALNRTTLARQALLERAAVPALDMVGHLVAVQAQEPEAPYVGLWTRLEGFGHDELIGLLEDRRVVRSSVLRATQHLVTAADYLWLRPLVQPVRSSPGSRPCWWTGSCARSGPSPGGQTRPPWSSRPSATRSPRPTAPR